METKRPRVVIIGAGFGGLFTARHLADKDADVTIIDRNNYHTFTPLIYQVATCGLSVEDVAYPVRKIFVKSSNVDFLLGEVTSILTDEKQVVVEMQSITRYIPYDYLIVAAGSVTNYFGNDNIERHSFGLKSMGDAVRLRNHVLRMFENADWRKGEEEIKALTTMVVVGGGPTGLETAGALYELYNNVLQKEHKNLRGKPVRVVLVELMDNLLGPYPAKLQASAREQLESMGVEVRTGVAVEEAGEGFVRLSNGEVIATRTLVWATGVKASPLAKMLEVELARGGRIPVEQTLQVKTLDDVYAIGDIAYLEAPNGRPYPQVIPVAQQQAELTANNILNRIAGKQQGTFKYVDKGSMATIGRSRAVAWVFNRIQLTGFIAWISWLALHLMTLLGFRNRISVFLNWVWSYVRYDRTSRIILNYPLEQEKEEMLARREQDQERKAS